MTWQTDTMHDVFYYYFRWAQWHHVRKNSDRLTITARSHQTSTSAPTLTSVLVHVGGVAGDAVLSLTPSPAHRPACWLGSHLRILFLLYSPVTVHSSQVNLLSERLDGVSHIFIRSESKKWTRIANLNMRRNLKVPITAWSSRKNIINESGKKSFNWF